MIEIGIQRGIDDEQWKHLLNWRERVFPEEGIGMQWALPEWHIIASDENGRAIGHIGFDSFPINVEGLPMTVVGVGGVVVRPEFQGQSVPAKLFNRLHSEAGSYLQADSFTLFCPQRLVAYYQKHGYRLHEGACYFLQKEESVLSSFQFMYRGAGIESAMNNDKTVRIPSVPW